MCIRDSLYAVPVEHGILLLYYFGHCYELEHYGLGRHEVLGQPADALEDDAAHGLAACRAVQLCPVGMLQFFGNGCRSVDAEVQQIEEQL